MYKPVKPSPHSQDNEHIHYPKKFPCAPFSALPYLPHPLATTGYAIGIDLFVFAEVFCSRWNHTVCILFCVIFSTNSEYAYITVLRFIHVVAHVSNLLLFSLSDSPHMSIFSIHMSH